MPRRFVLKSSPVPFSIKLAAASMVVFQFGGFQLMGLPPAALIYRAVAHPNLIVAVVGWVAVVSWCVVATLRMSRWPLIAITGMGATWAAWRVTHLMATAPTTISLLLGWTVMASVVSLLLILPHWRQLNWLLLGRLARPEDLAEHFT